MKLAPAIAAIEKHGMLLVYPLKDRPDPSSLWRVLHPRATMRWAWDSEADERVAELWHLRESLARTRRVVYAKWYGGRATFFARDVFRAMLARLRSADRALRGGLTRDACVLLDALEESSPLATKALRAAADLQGKLREPTYTRAMRTLWSRLLLVGMGEAEEGGFPSLSIGATRLVLEDLWEAAAEIDAPSDARLSRALEASPAFARAFERVRAELARATRAQGIGSE